MDDFSGKLHMEPDDAYGGGVSLNRLAVSRAGVQRSRSRAAVVRRGPRRMVTATVPIFSVYSLQWSLDVSNDLPSMRTVLEALCDKGSMETITGGNRWSIGLHDAGARTFTAHTVSAAGEAHKYAGGICRELSLGMATGAIASLMTTWEFLSCTEEAEADPDDEADPSEFGSPVDATITWDGGEIPTFSLSLNFSRELSPGDLDDDRRLRGYAGRHTVDIAGRMTVRLDSDAITEHFQGESIHELAITMPAGETTLKLIFPNVKCIMTGSAVVGLGMVEHQLEFVAMAVGGSPAATVELTAA